MTAMNSLSRLFGASFCRIPLLADAARRVVSLSVCLLDVRVILPAT